jgi:hypothetical protein
MPEDGRVRPKHVVGECVIERKMCSVITDSSADFLQTN